MKNIPQYKIGRLQRLLRADEVKKEYFFVRVEDFDLYDREPFRTETFGIALLGEGSFELYSGLEKNVVDGPAIFALGPDVIRSFQRTEEGKNPTLAIVFFTERFFVESQTDIFYLNRFPFFEEQYHHVFQLDKKTIGRFTVLYQQIDNLLNERHRHEAQMMKSYISILIHETDSLYREQTEGDDKKNNLPLLANFKTLLAKDFRQERTVAHYAGKLNVTAKYLSEYLKQHSGRTAGQWIDEMITLEAKVLLQQKELSVAQVSDRLSFADQSIFGKFFKSNTGLSPLRYRKSHE